MCNSVRILITSFNLAGKKKFGNIYFNHHCEEKQHIMSYRFPLLYAVERFKKFGPLVTSFACNEFAHNNSNWEIGGYTTVVLNVGCLEPHKFYCYHFSGLSNTFLPLLDL